MKKLKIYQKPSIEKMEAIMSHRILVMSPGGTTPLDPGTGGGTGEKPGTDDFDAAQIRTGAGAWDEWGENSN